MGVDSGQLVMAGKLQQAPFKQFAVTDIENRADQACNCPVPVVKSGLMELHPVLLAVDTMDQGLVDLDSGLIKQFLVLAMVEPGILFGVEIEYRFADELLTPHVDELLKSAVAAEIDSIGILVEDRNGQGIDDGL